MLSLEPLTNRLIELDKLLELARRCLEVDDPTEDQIVEARLCLRMADRLSTSFLDALEGSK